MRILSWAALSFAVGIICMHYVLPQSLVFPVIIAAAIIAIGSVIILRGKMRISVAVICVFLVFGIVRYEAQVNNKLDSVAYMVGNSYEVQAVVLDYPVLYDDGRKVTICLETEGFPSCKVSVFDRGDTMSLVPGDVVEATMKFSSATVVSAEETDSYISKGIYLRGQITEKMTYLGRSEHWLLYAPLRIGESIRTIIDQYVPQRSAVFMKALLTGDKTALYDEPLLQNALAKAGLSHVVAVSGLHVSFVLGLIAIVFGQGRGWFLSIISIVIFALMTGLSPSVLRAVMMQSLFLLAPILRREADGFTSICFALFVLLLCNPFMIGSISLQLSFLAMAGIILITPYAVAWFEERGDNINTVLSPIYWFVTSSFSASLGAMIFTLPVCAIHFGNINIMGFVTNLLVLWIVPYCFAFGFLVCGSSIISDTIALFIGKLLGYGVEFIYSIAELVGDIPFASVYLPNKLTALWFLIVAASIVVMIFIKSKSPWKVAIPIAMASVSMIIMLGYNSAQYNSGVTIAAIDVGQGQCIVVLQNENTVVIDCGGSYDSGDAAVRWLKSHGRTTVDQLILTHFDEDHVNGVVDLLSLMDVREIVYSAKHINKDNQHMFSDVQEAADAQGTAMTIVLNQRADEIGELKIRSYASEGKNSNDGLIVLISERDYDLLVLGDSDFEAEKHMVKRLGPIDGECLIVGHHGSKYSTCDQILDAFKPETAIISCGFNTYGHPTTEVLDRLTKRNVVLYRTDLQGSIEVRVR